MRLLSVLLLLLSVITLSVLLSSFFFNALTRTWDGITYARYSRTITSIIRRPSEVDSYPAMWLPFRYAPSSLQSFIQYKNRAERSMKIFHIYSTLNTVKLFFWWYSIFIQHKSIESVTWLCANDLISRYFEAWFWFFFCVNARSIFTHLTLVTPCTHTCRWKQAGNTQRVLNHFYQDRR